MSVYHLESFNNWDRIIKKGIYLTNPMTVYFYHMIPLEESYRDWQKSQYPGHLLYGFTFLQKNGIDVIFHRIPFNPYKWRLRLSFYNFFSILFCRKKFDAIYAVTHNGLELLIYLRALKLYRKPIVIWHHSAIIIPENRLRRIFSNLFYKGIDKACFFSQSLLDKSIETRKIQRKNAFLIHWGADLAFYDGIKQHSRNENTQYISTGQENRDITTLIEAFNQTNQSCEIYLPAWNPIYKTQLQKKLTVNENIRLFYVNAGYIEMAKKVNEAFAVVIPCLNYPYTVGLTSLVEAMALGLPVITTDNPTYPVDVEKEHIGIKVPYGDVNAWVNAIQYLSAHPEEAKKMGNNARNLAEKKYNLELFAKEIKYILLSLHSK
jgi:glycosyltransferase involved in cell wall biosynthesis